MNPQEPEPRQRFLGLVRSAVEGGSLLKLTLGRPGPGAEAGLNNLFVRPVALKAGPRLAFVWRYATKDITRNHAPGEGLGLLESLVGGAFLDAHLFSGQGNAQLQCGGDRPRLKLLRQKPGMEPPGADAPGAGPANDRPKRRVLRSDAPWLQSLGVLDPGGRPKAGMGDKYRQIQRYAELLEHLAEEAPLPADRELSVCDMGSGKGYLTFAAAELFGDRARVTGIEARADLVDFCNRAAEAAGLAPRLSFRAGVIGDAALDPIDILIALHACDTATDDALARGIAAGSPLIVVAPCCQKELRSALVPPGVLEPALRHGIFRERQAEFVTDSIRALILTWAGYRTRVFEFIATEHTAKNTMIAAVKAQPPGDPAAAAELRAFARFYGIRRQALAEKAGVSLDGPDGNLDSLPAQPK